MNTVEIIVMFEDARNALEEQRKEEQRKREKHFISKIEQLRELEELIEEAKAEAEEIKDEIKEEMERRNTEEMKVGRYIVRWTEVLSNRFDSTGFKKLFPEVYKQFTKQVASKRFTISA